MSKGSRSRVSDRAAYARNYERIFGMKRRDDKCTCYKPEHDGATGYVNVECPLHGNGMVARLIEAVHGKTPKSSAKQSRRITVQRGFQRLRKD